MHDDDVRIDGSIVTTTDAGELVTTSTGDRRSKDRWRVKLNYKWEDEQIYFKVIRVRLPAFSACIEMLW